MADAMTLPDFLDASYALMAEEHQRINPFKDLLSVSSEFTPTPGREQVKTTVAKQNQEGMEMLQGVLKNVQGAPTRKPRRA